VVSYSSGAVKMKANLIPLIVGLLVFISSLLSLEIGLSVAIIEIVLGVIAGNLGLRPEDWMLYLAGFGGIILTFLAGAEIDTKLMKERFRESLLIGTASFLTPFLAASLFTYYAVGWSLSASLITGITLSETSIAVVYSVLVETNLLRTRTGKMIMAATLHIYLYFSLYHCNCPCNQFLSLYF
jgi:Kef-type K+ transport system membrane component KefB